MLYYCTILLIAVTFSSHIEISCGNATVIVQLLASNIKCILISLLNLSLGIFTF